MWANILREGGGSSGDKDSDGDRVRILVGEYYLGRVEIKVEILVRILVVEYYLGRVEIKVEIVVRILVVECYLGRVEIKVEIG